ncbi:YopX protein [Sebaldella termitidis]|uniref:YopX protein domain-containing protein n=1 Tax=Sebaldella termitidis (strain ATCC 33386 / NCTC 11300) TaxID=526218 RepID=D1AR22_SEBTE|nr:YopX family protein [Sebaldella termitidis]ACZ07710.1 hypothetical protein Sterm_0838 [Sebaldella termitidis ATCC 33386]SUI23007.1 YopX protein [Sebaldella termitidis]
MDKLRVWIEKKKLLGEVREVNYIDKIVWVVGQWGGFRSEDAIFMKPLMKKDITGKDIFEGDIIQFHDNDGNAGRMIVKYGELEHMVLSKYNQTLKKVKMWGFYFEVSDEDKKVLWRAENDDRTENDIEKEIKIVGNIYENKS